MSSYLLIAVLILVTSLIVCILSVVTIKKKNYRKKNIVEIIIDKKTDITYIKLTNKSVDKKITQKPYILSLAKDESIVGVSFRGTPSIKVVHEN